MLTRGVESILDTTFLSALATPIAALTGMVIAFLVVRKRFSGKEALDFASNLGGAVPGTILGIGFVLAFSTPPLVLVVHPVRPAGLCWRCSLVAAACWAERARRAGALRHRCGVGAEPCCAT